MSRTLTPSTTILAAALICLSQWLLSQWPQSSLLAAETLSSRWSKVRDKIKYGSDGEFKGSIEEGRKILGEAKVLMKEAKEKSPGIYRQIDRECKKLAEALDRNKMMAGVERGDEVLDASYEKALACKQTVKDIEAKAQEATRLLTEDELDAIDAEWETCLKLVKTLKSTIIKLRQNCQRLSGDYDRKWDEYDRKVDRLRDIAEKARDELRARRKAKR